MNIIYALFNNQIDYGIFTNIKFVKEYILNYYINNINNKKTIFIVKEYILNSNQVINQYNYTFEQIYNDLIQKIQYLNNDYQLILKETDVDVKANEKVTKDVTKEVPVEVPVKVTKEVTKDIEINKEVEKDNKDLSKYNKEDISKKIEYIRKYFLHIFFEHILQIS